MPETSVPLPFRKRLHLSLFHVWKRWVSFVVVFQSPKGECRPIRLRPSCFPSIARRRHIRLWVARQSRCFPPFFMLLAITKKEILFKVWNKLYKEEITKPQKVSAHLLIQVRLKKSFFHFWILKTKDAVLFPSKQRKQSPFYEIFPVSPDFFAL